MTSMNTIGAPADATDQFLTFVLGGDEYGLEILKVQEIRAFSAITPLPNTPPYVRGVMNLRGAVIPIIDLRQRLGVTAGHADAHSVIVVVTLGTRVAGLIVDAVSDVLTVAADDRAPMPELGAVDVTMLTGLARTGERLVLLVDVENILAASVPRGMRS